MFKICTKPKRFAVVCQCQTHPNGSDHCHQCNDLGWHYKRIPIWYVSRMPVDIEKIDTDSNGNIRFWVSKSEYYYKKTGRIFSTKKNAQIACGERNKKIIKDLYAQYPKYTGNKDRTRRPR